MSVYGFFHLFDATKVEDLSIGLKAPIQRQADLPRASKYLRIFNSCFIANGVPADRRVSLYDVEGVAMKVSSPVEPRVRREIGHIDDKRISLPVTDRVAHVRVARVLIDF